MEFTEVDGFRKDMKRLSKRFRTLEEDVKVVRKVLAVEPDARPPFSVRIDGLGITGCVIKIRKIACRSLKGKGAESGLRIVYAYFPAESKITMIEIYYKGDKEKEDLNRILEFFKR